MFFSVSSPFLVPPWAVCPPPPQQLHMWPTNGCRDRSPLRRHVTTFPRRKDKQKTESPGGNFYLGFPLTNRWILKENTGVFSVITVSKNSFTRWYIYRFFSSFLKTQIVGGRFLFGIHYSLDQQCLCCVHTHDTNLKPSATALQC